MLFYLCNIEVSIEKIWKRKDFLFDIFELNGIIFYFRLWIWYVVLVFLLDLCVLEKLFCYVYFEFMLCKD